MKRLCLSWKVGTHLWISVRIRLRPFVTPRKEAWMADGVHDDGHGSERATVVEPQHFDTWIVGAVGVKPNHGATVDHLAAVDAECDLVLSIADRNCLHVGGRLRRCLAQLRDQFSSPGGIGLELRAGMIV